MYVYVYANDSLARQALRCSLVAGQQVLCLVRLIRHSNNDAVKKLKTFFRAVSAKKRSTSSLEELIRNAYLIQLEDRFFSVGDIFKICILS